MNIKLTKRQKQIYEHIVKYMKDFDGISPSLPDLMEITGITTKKGVASHLDCLERKGYIKRTGEARGIRILLDESGDFERVPLLGYANAGEPLIQVEEEYHGELLVHKRLLKSKRKVFGVELRGDSMNKRLMNGITMENSNFVIIVKEEDVKNGDVVLAEINGGATVKTYKKEGEICVLYPESNNPIHKPIYMQCDKGQIIGRVVTVLNNPNKDN